MKVLFCHDGPMTKDDNNDYYGSAHNDEMFKRYYKIAPKLKVAIRVKNELKENIEDKLDKITEPIEFIECPDISSINGQIFNKQKAKRTLTKAIADVDYVVVRLPSLLGYLAYDIARKKDKPCLVEVVTCTWDSYFNHSFKGKLAAPFAYYGLKKRVRDAEYVIYVTNEFLQRRYPTEGKNISASNVLLTSFDNEIINHRIEKINNLEKNQKKIIGTVANVNVRFKGQQYVIEALGKLKDRGITNFEYHLVGNGDQTYLRKKAKEFNVEEQVKFIGAMPHKKVFKWLETIDIYVQPSRQEGLPRALIEAMSRGLPACGANTAGIPELLEEEFIFSNTRKNIKEICNILLKFNKNIMEEQAKRNYKESKKYSKEIIENRRQNFFEKFSLGK